VLHVKAEHTSSGMFAVNEPPSLRSWPAAEHFAWKSCCNTARSPLTANLRDPIRPASYTQKGQGRSLHRLVRPGIERGLKT
jgi:hypothetical protein